MLYTPSVINIVGVNANGIRTKRKRLMLLRLLRELKASAGIITETHMRRAELGRLRFPDYYIGSEYCRPTPSGERIGGGVLILINRGIVAEAIERKTELDKTIEHCVVRLFPAEDPRMEMRVTGVYITPSNTAGLTMHQLQAVGGTTQGYATGEETPHLLIGNLNTRSWSQLYAEWTCTQGLQELVDPDVPTFAMGSSIDKILFLPGFYIPSTFLPPGSTRFQDSIDLGVAPYYPVSPCLAITRPLWSRSRARRDGDSVEGENDDSEWETSRRRTGKTGRWG